MQPFGSGAGQLLHRDLYLCDVDYEIAYPLGFANIFHIHRLRLRPQGHEAASLTTLADLILVIADGTQYRLPPTLALTEAGELECTVNLGE